ncbi:MAG: hypothetical protein ACYCZC_09905 [Acidithiobacillus sp.]
MPMCFPLRALAGLIWLRMLSRLRAPWAFLYGLGLPTLAYLAFGLNPHADAAWRLEFAGSCATFATFGVVLTSSLSSQHQLHDPWNRYQRVLPLGTAMLLGALLAENALLILLSAGLVLAVAVLTGVSVPWAGTYLALLLGSIPVALLALALSHWVRSQELPVVSSILYMGLSFVGGLWSPPQNLPPLVALISPWTPTRVWGEMVWAAIGNSWAPLEVWLKLGGWSVLGLALVLIARHHQQLPRFR